MVHRPSALLKRCLCPPSDCCRALDLDLTSLDIECDHIIFPSDKLEFSFIPCYFLCSFLMLYIVSFPGFPSKILATEMAYPSAQQNCTLFHGCILEIGFASSNLYSIEFICNLDTYCLTLKLIKGLNAGYFPVTSVKGLLSGRCTKLRFFLKIIAALNRYINY